MLKVLYKCSCLKEEVYLWVKPRGETEPIMSFMSRVTRAVSEDHSHRSALCMSRKMEYVKLPVGEGGVVGRKD